MSDAIPTRSEACARGFHGTCLMSGCQCGCHRPLTPELTWRALEFLLVHALRQIEDTIPALEVGARLKGADGLLGKVHLEFAMLKLAIGKEILAAGPDVEGGQ